MLETRGDVYLAKARQESAIDAIASACDEMQLDQRLANCRRVFLKPNLVSDVPEYIEKGCNTSPAVIEGVARYLADFEHLEVLLGEADTGTQVKGRKLDRALRIMGLYDLAEKYGIKIVNLTEDEKTLLKFPEGLSLRELEMGRSLVESDLIINLPKIKTHKYATVTCAMKNMFGVIPDPLRVKYHRDLDRVIVDLNRVFEGQMFVVMDGIVGMEGLGPLWGQPVELNLLLFSHNNYLADLIATQIMGIPSGTVGYVEIFHNHFDSRTRSDITIRGEPIIDHIHTFVLPQPNLFIKLEGALKRNRLTRTVMFHPWIQRNLTYWFRGLIRRMRGGGYSWYLDEEHR